MINPEAPVAERKTSGGGFASALAGGVIGAILTLAFLFLAAPQLISGRIVRDGLMRDPQVLNDAVAALQDAQYKPILDTERAKIEKPFAAHWRGAADGDVTLVEFFDYACGYCKASNAVIDKLIADDPKLRVVYRELPILGPNSATAARLSLQASKIGRFGPFHDTLWAAGKPTPEALARAAAAAGIPPEPKPDQEIEAELQSNYKLASALGATGTPLFVIGDKVMNGAVGYDALKAAVADARKASRKP